MRPLPKDMFRCRLHECQQSLPDGKGCPQPVPGQTICPTTVIHTEKPHCMRNSQLICDTMYHGSWPPSPCRLITALCSEFHWLCGKASANAAPGWSGKVVFFYFLPRLYTKSNPQPLLFLSSPLCATLRAFRKRSSCISLLRSNFNQKIPLGIFCSWSAKHRIPDCFVSPLPSYFV